MLISFGKIQEFSAQVNESKDEDRVIYIYNILSLYTNITG